MPDFSYLAVTTPAMIARYAAGGQRPTDGMLLDAVRTMKSGCLSPRERAAIVAVLGRRLGRPHKRAPSRQVLVVRVMAIDEGIAPLAFREALAKRLKSKNGLSDFEWRLRNYKASRRKERDMFMRGLYRDFYALLPSDDVVVHPIIGPLAVPKGHTSRSHQALALTQEQLRRFEHDPPSLRRMENIVSERIKPKPFRESKALG